MAQRREAGYDDEAAAAILLPHFDAVRDTFSEFETEDGRLEKIDRVKFLIDSDYHDSERHFAACRTDGKLIYFAPQIVKLKHESVVAIIAHELGHAADFLYPAHWMTALDGEAVPAKWIGEPTSSTVLGWRRIWEERSPDQVEWAADAIAYRIIGKKIGYCGPCMIQCFSGKPRPRGLR